MLSKFPFCSSLNRGQIDKENRKGKCYNKATFRFSFGAECQISLIGARFLGLPPNSKEAEIAATIQVEVTESPIFKDVGANLGTFFPRHDFKVNLKKEESVVVEFPYPVRIPKGNWADIGFQIEGPWFIDIHNRRRRKGLPTQTLVEKSRYDHTHLSGDGLVRFHTTCSKSPLQLQEVFFLLP